MNLLKNITKRHNIYRNNFENRKNPRAHNKNTQNAPSFMSFVYI